MADVLALSVASDPGGSHARAPLRVVAAAWLEPTTLIRCGVLHCTLRACVCAARQAATDAQRPRHVHAGKLDLRRGEASDYPHCDTRRCAQGRRIREALDPAARLEWRGAGPNGRFDRGRSDAEAQFLARIRLERAGLLGPVPSLDEPPPEADEPSGERETELPGACQRSNRLSDAQ